MSLYFGETEMQGLHFGDTEITGLYFGDMGIWTAWSTYDGTLPATYTANGSALADYRVYGAAGGVGDKTKNLINTVDMTPQYYVNINAALAPASNWKVYYVPVTAGETYTCSGLSGTVSSAWIGYCNAQKSIIGTVGTAITTAAQTVTAPANAAYLALSNRDGAERPMCVLGSTAPASYVPYGYEVDMSVSDGTASTTTPIYIGSDPLGEDEYVNYEEGKIYRRPNLYDANATDISKGYLSDRYLYGNIIGSNPNWFISEYMPISASTDYIASGLVDKDASGVIATINIYNSNKQLEGYETINSSGNTEINSGVNGAFMRISARNEHKNTVVVKSKNALPTNPPVPLPQLPTVDGVNVVDYAGQSAATPSEFYAKYKKGDHST